MDCIISASVIIPLMKAFIRTYVLVFISLYLTQYLIGGFEYPEEFSSSYVLMALCISLISFFVFPLFKILGFSTRGLMGLLLCAILTGLAIYVLVSFILEFQVVSTVLPQIEVLGIVLPAKNLSPIESLVSSSLTFSIIYRAFSWLFSGKR